MKVIHVVSAVLFPLIALLASCSATVVETGNIGLVKTFGKIHEEPLQSGFSFVNPFASVLEVTTREIPLSLVDLKPKSRDNLTMADVDVDIYLSMNPSKVPSLAIKYLGDVTVLQNGTAVGLTRAHRAAQEAIFQTIATFDATTMHLKREEIAGTLSKRLQEELDTSDKGAYLVTTVNVKSLNTDKALEASIRSALQTDQDIAKKNKEVELANAEARRLKAEADGQAVANRIIAESITPNLLRLKEIEQMRLTAEAVAAKPGNTVFMGGSATPLFNVNK